MVMLPFFPLFGAADTRPGAELEDRRPEPRHDHEQQAGGPHHEGEGPQIPSPVRQLAAKEVAGGQRQQRHRDEGGPHEQAYTEPGAHDPGPEDLDLHHRSAAEYRRGQDQQAAQAPQAG